MLDTKAIEVCRALFELNEVYKRPRFVFTSKDARSEAVREDCTFVGTFSRDDWSVVDTIKRLLEQGSYVLAIAEGQDVSVYRC